MKKITIITTTISESVLAKAFSHLTKDDIKRITTDRENCDCSIREVIVDVYGRKIILSGQHAFEYSITVISITGRIVITDFKNGKEARKEFYKYKRKK